MKKEIQIDHNMCVDSITDFIFVDNVITQSDIILIPGGSHPQLAEKAAELYRQGMAKYILVSGHANPNIPDYSSEADYLKSIAISMGVPSEAIVCEHKASNTFENAEFSLALIKSKGLNVEKAIIVCKAFHSRRSLLTYEYVFPNETKFLVSTITDKRGLNKDNWTTKQEHINMVMSEVEKIGRYFRDKIIAF